MGLDSTKASSSYLKIKVTWRHRFFLHICRGRPMCHIYIPSICPGRLNTKKGLLQYAYAMRCKAISAIGSGSFKLANPFSSHCILDIKTGREGNAVEFFSSQIRLNLSAAWCDIYSLSLLHIFLSISSTGLSVMQVKGSSKLTEEEASATC